MRQAREIKWTESDKERGTIFGQLANKTTGRSQLSHELMKLPSISCECNIGSGSIRVSQHVKGRIGG